MVFPGYKEKLEFTPNLFKTDIKYKWSTIEDKFRCGANNRMYDEYPTLSPTSTDFLPLYSSFSKDGQLAIPELPGKKMEASNGENDKIDIPTRRSQMFDTLFKKKENMFNRVSPESSLIKTSKSAYDLKAPSKSPKKSKFNAVDDFSKTSSLLKKCALQGIRASGFKTMRSE